MLLDVEEPLPAVGVGEFDVDNTSRGFQVVLHQKMVIVTPDCDLLSDFYYRFGSQTAEQNEQAALGSQSQILRHVLCCDVYEEVELKSSLPKGSEIWRRVKRNQDERYQHIPSGIVVGRKDDNLPDYFLDFKRVFTLPTEWLYETLSTGKATRNGVIPSPWVHSMAGRLFNYQGRIGLPDPSDNRQFGSQPQLLAIAQVAALPKPTADA